MGELSKIEPVTFLDLVVYMGADSRKAFEAAAELMSDDEGPASAYDDETCSQRWRFGRLDLIVCFEGGAFDDWERGTRDLVKIKPVTREQAVRYFAAVRSGLDVFSEDTNEEEVPRG